MYVRQTLVAARGSRANERSRSAIKSGCNRSCNMVVTRRPVSRFELLQRLEIPRVDDERLLADRVGADAKREADVRIVQIVGRADAHIVHAVGLVAATQLLEVAIESLDFCEEADVERVSIQHAHGVVRIDGRNQPVSRVVDRLEVSRRDEAGDASDRKILHRASADRKCVAGTTPPAARSSAGELWRVGLERIPPLDGLPAGRAMLARSPASSSSRAACRPIHSACRREQSVDAVRDDLAIDADRRPQSPARRTP